MKPIQYLGLSALLILSLFQGRSLAGEVNIAVAANFTDAARKIGILFKQTSGHVSKLSYGSTGKLYAQIAHGAPFEVFLAADDQRPLKAEQAGLAVAGSRFVYAKGKLVLWSARDAFQDGEAYLKQAGFSHLAIANPKTAPYGLAARQMLEHLGLWERLQDKLVRGDSIAQTFQFVATGNAEAGLVAYSQIKGWQGEPGALWRIPDSYYAPIAQAAVLLRTGESNPAARAFLDFLKSDAAREVIESYGYAVE
jgi:molybdate transport system substrate-binding protein